METLTKDILADRIKERLGLPLKESKDILETVIELIKSNLEFGTDVKISGFGKWVVIQKKARQGRNPHDGKSLKIAARKVVVFYSSDRLRESVNGLESYPAKADQ